jgi:hypothetical protein
MSKKKKTIGEGLLKGMEDALEHAQSAALKHSSKSLSQEEDSSDAKHAHIEAESFHDDNRDKDQTLDLQEVQSITDTELQKELKRFLIPKLRSASYRWSERSKAIKAARVSRGLYKCAMCLREDLKNVEFVMDHREPVVPFEGWNGTDWTQYINRMFVKAELFQALCKPCHELKTDTETQIRKMHRERKKKENKS